MYIVLDPEYGGQLPSADSGTWRVDTDPEDPG
jgi:hypothetical protein